MYVKPSTVHSPEPPLPPTSTSFKRMSSWVTFPGFKEYIWFVPFYFFLWLQKFEWGCRLVLMQVFAVYQWHIFEWSEDKLFVNNLPFLMKNRRSTTDYFNYNVFKPNLWKLWEMFNRDRKFLFKHYHFNYWVRFYFMWHVFVRLLLHSLLWK